MTLRVTSHPTATVLTDDIFDYLVIQYEKFVEVYRSEKGGVYEIHKMFPSQEEFEQRFPQTAEAIKQDQKERMMNHGKR